MDVSDRHVNHARWSSLSSPALAADQNAGHAKSPDVAVGAFDHELCVAGAGGYTATERLGCDGDPSGCRHDP